MIFVYNFLQVLLLPAALPVLAVLILARKKYRGHIIERLGLKLRDTLPPAQGRRQRIWIHCLSVGEVTSALPLVREIRRQTDACVIFSVTTSSGLRVARARIKPYVDAVIPGPVDLLPVINRFINLILPDLFILVETDFWPNWLVRLRQQRVPTMLVNGRISSSSFTRYKRFRLFFAPLFNSFSQLAVQTAQDRGQLVRLGVPEERISTPGNLKYGAAQSPPTGADSLPGRSSLNLAQDSLVWLCGSTHPGEEEILLSSFAALQRENSPLFLIIAPRDPDRTAEIVRLAAARGLRSMRRTAPSDPTAPLMILDTMGELADFYRLADMAFIGGSLVPCGGHNPLEAAICGIPVLFGPHMEDFAEIARDLEQDGGGRTVHSQEEITRLVRQFMADGQLRQQAGRAARQLVDRNSRVISRYMKGVTTLLKVTAN